MSAAIWLMARLNCVHPPGCALALFLVLDGPYVMAKMWLTAGLVLLNVEVMLVAVAVNNLLGRRYPFIAVLDAANLHHTADIPPTARIAH